MRAYSTVFDIPIEECYPFERKLCCRYVIVVVFIERMNNDLQKFTYCKKICFARCCKSAQWYLP